MGDKIYYCGRRTKKCRACKRKYTREEYDLWECPECGEPRACRQVVKKEGQACKVHGGASPKGANSPNFKDGKYSKYMPGPLLDKYADFVRDEDKLGVEGELDVARAILAQQIQSIGGMNTIEAYNRALAQVDNVRGAILEGDESASLTALMALEDTLREGAGYMAEIAGVNKTMDIIRKLTDSQRQIYQAHGEFVTRQFVIYIIDLIVGGLDLYVKPLDGSQEALNNINAIFTNILTGLSNQTDNSSKRRSPGLINRGS